MENYIERDIYLKKIEQFLDKPIIKIIIGMRRVGKSILLKLLINRLKNKGVPPDNIIYINKESLQFEFIKNYKDLYEFTLKNFSNKSGKKYLIIDEVQLIDKWEKAVISIFSENIADIIISGSNSSLLSTELATLLSGRYIEIPVHPLTFKEFLIFRNNPENIEEEFKNYLKFGGLPGIHMFPLDEEIIFDYINSILNTILFKDILIRYKIRDVALLDKLVRFLFDNIGNITSAKKISDFLKSQRLKLSVDTVLNYIKYIESALIIYRIPRFDIKGKRQLEFNEKIFLNDIGIRHGLIGYKEKDINGLIENIVFKELQVRGYQVYIGKLDSYEIDFIAIKQNEKKYIQVTNILTDIDREFGNLEKIKDNYEKIVISMDKFFPSERNGIIHKYLIDFLLEE